MNAHTRWTLWLIDLLGAGGTAALAAVFVWLVFFRGDHTAAEIRELRAVVAAGRKDLSTLRASLERQRGLHRLRQEELASHGQLPDYTPIEEYFQTLSRLATAGNVRVVRQNPLTQRSYPGLLEQRYAYEVAGSMPDLARFFRALEDAEFWADISYLKIDAGSGRGESASHDRVAVLTISVFSAIHGEEPDDRG